MEDLQYTEIPVLLYQENYTSFIKLSTVGQQSTVIMVQSLLGLGEKIGIEFEHCDNKFTGVSIKLYFD